MYTGFNTGDFRPYTVDGLSADLDMKDMLVAMARIKAMESAAPIAYVVFTPALYGSGKILQGEMIQDTLANTSGPGGWPLFPDFDPKRHRGFLADPALRPHIEAIAEERPPTGMFTLRTISELRDWPHGPSEEK